MELEVPKKPIFKRTLSIVIVQHVLQWEEAKEVLLLQMPRDHGKNMSL